MITKDQLRDSLTRECDIASHLFTKLSPESYSYRPAPEQRSTVELLRYLAICATGAIRCMSEANWKLFSEYSERVKEMPAEGFPQMMALQKGEIEAFFDRASEEMLAKEAPMPGGAVTAPLAVAILNGPLKWLAAYKMQLFLYAKASGATDLKTSNLWRGVDAKP
ncbi:MAG TPA: hypothetical protein VHL58_17435 [Thermoanaerobaculia bacterium]|nr:hypothetical protein [Thermoanaerobaculia bacterium]